MGLGSKKGVELLPIFEFDESQVSELVWEVLPFGWKTFWSLPELGGGSLLGGFENKD